MSTGEWKLFFTLRFFCKTMNAQTDPHHGSVANSWGCLDNGFSIFYQTICSIHFVIIRKFRGRALLSKHI